MDLCMNGIKPAKNSTGNYRIY